MADRKSSYRRPARAKAGEVDFIMEMYRPLHEEQNEEQEKGNEHEQQEQGSSGADHLDLRRKRERRSSDSGELPGRTGLRR